MDLRRLLPAASAPVLALALSACGATWTPMDGGDGDGVSIAQGDCDESPTTGASIGPDQDEIHYDGVDQNCNGNDDENDKDGDGIAAVEFGGTDCWDDPEIVPDAYVALNGLPQLGAADVFPGAPADTLYDGIDQDCAGDSDFDKDGDGFDTVAWPQRDGSVGGDCWDADDEDAPTVATCNPDGSGALLTAADVNPAAAESSPLDGIDQDCTADATIIEFDVDGDSFPFCEECDDANASIFPDPTIPEVWYNGVDENCDLNDGDQDGDGFVDAGYTEPGATFYGTAALDPDGDGTDNFRVGDCWDTPDSRPETFRAINGLPQPSAAEVHPDVQDDTPYDDVDQDCAGDSDFDVDRDGQDTRDFATRTFGRGADCDDDDPVVFLGSLSESPYDGVDTDCEGDDDYDVDRDGHVPDAYVGLATTYAAGTGLLPGGDCDDLNPGSNPSEPNELCATDFDDDCDGNTNDVNATGAQRFYADVDRDGYGDPAVSRLTCIAEGDFDVPYFAAEEVYTDTVPTPDTVDTNPVANRAWDVGELYTDANGNGRIDLFDCDDTSPVAADRFPGNPEVVGDGIDQDCNVARDEDASGTLDPAEQANVDDCYVDDDNDGFGTAVVRRGLSLDCTEDNKLAKVDGDCRDVGANARFAYPGAAPRDSAVDCMMDRDGDLWGFRVAPTGPVETGFDAIAGTDCDDADAGDYPGAPEIAANGDDEDCDVTPTNPHGTDLCFVDADDDGFGTDATVAGSTLDCTADPGVASERWIGAETYTDTNGNHRWDDGEPYTDVNGNGRWDDTEPFEDRDFNGERNVPEAFVDTDGDGRWTAGDRVVDCLDRTSVHPAAAHAFPGAAEAENSVACMMDADEDGYGDDDLGKPSRDTSVAAGFLAGRTLTPGTTLTLGTDCDDSGAQDKPGATEFVGNLDDEDCTDTEICYVNTDRDAHRVGPSGSRLTTAVTDALEVASADMDCDDAGEAPAFYVAGMPAVSVDGTTPSGADDRNGDCIDDPVRHAAAAHAYPGAAETESGTLCMMDADEDGYGDDDGSGAAAPGRDWRDDGAEADILHAVVPTEGTVVSYGNDCDDSSDQDHPGADERVGNLDDEDCNDTPGEICYVDEDGDDYRTGPDGARFRAEVDAMVNATGALTVASADMDCGDVGEAPAFYESAMSTVAVRSVDGDTPSGADFRNGDCLDNPSLHPDAVFAYPGAAPNDEAVACMMDADVDGYGDDDGGQAARDSYVDPAFEGAGVLAAIEATPQTDVARDTTLVMGTDCDDSSAQDFPGGAEIVSNGDDEDCDTKDDCLDDHDNDDWAASGAARVDSVAIAALDASLCSNEAGRAPSRASVDCDDDDIADYPNATETIGNLDDEDCDGAEICYRDADGDGYRVGPAGAQLTSAVTSTLWTASSGASADMDCADAGEAAASVPNGDCIDSTAVHASAARTYPRAVGATYGGVPWQDGAGCVMDADLDGYGDDDRRMASRDTSTTVVLTGGSATVTPTESTTITAGTDCDDSSASDNPGATEIVGNEDDDDCTNETEYCYVNKDADSYRVGPSYTAGHDAAHLVTAVSPATLYVSSPDRTCAAAGEAPRTLAHGDCIDDPAVHPNANKAFPNAGTNEAGALRTACLMDADSDGYGDDDLGSSLRDTAATAGALRALVATTGTTFTQGTDCDDSSASDNPNATEVVGNLDDENCNNAEICYVNADGDAYRVGPAGAQLTTAVSASLRVASTDMDCSDAGEAAASVSNGDCLDNGTNAASAFPGAAPNNSASACMMDADGDDYGSTDAPGTGTAGTDCDDTDSGDYPTATEIVGNLDDEDCNNAEICYVNADGDSYRVGPSGAQLVSVVSASLRVASTDMDCTDAGEAAASVTIGDCLDTGTNAASTFPGAAPNDSATACMMDADGDDYGTDAVVSGVTSGSDCDDADSGDFPTATEIVGNLDDENCDTTEICYVNADGDGHRVGPSGAQLTSAVSDSLRVASADMDCSDAGEAAASVSNGDCLDTGTNAASTFPGAAPHEAGGSTACMMDVDGDDYGTNAVVAGVTSGTDCDDADSGDYPTATEIVGNLDDENCNNTEICYVNADGDAYRVGPAGAQLTSAVSDALRVASADMDCSDSGEAAASVTNGDCRDSGSNAASTFPGAAPNDSPTACMMDADGDDYGTSALESGVTSGTDCDDSDSGDYPTATEIVGNLDDEDCNNTEICYVNADGDGHRVGPSGAQLTSAVSDSLRVASTDMDCSDAGEAAASVPNGDCVDTGTNAASTFPGAAQAESGTECRTDVDDDGYGSVSAPAGGTAGGDCLDSGTNAVSAFPGAAPNDSTTACMMDVDGDNYGSTSAPGTGSVGTDCDDADSGDYPTATEVVGNLDDEDCDNTEICYVNADGDGYRVGPAGAQLTSAVTVTLRVASADMDCTDSGEAAASVSNGDCLDSGPNAVDTFPGAAPNEAGGSTSCMMDADGDDYGTNAVVSGVTSGTDCDDADSGDYPTATEIVGNLDDENCNNAEICYVNADGDAYRVGPAGAQLTTSVADSLRVASTDMDCSDSGEAAASVSNGDCLDSGTNASSTFPRTNGTAGWLDSSGCMTDADGDHYGALAAGAGVSAGTDCDDAHATAYPGGVDIPADGINGDCSAGDVCYVDADSDTYGSSSTVSSADLDCADQDYSGSLDEANDSDDCDDTDATVNPGVSETIGDGIDKNCNGAEICYADADNDNYRHDSNTVVSANLVCTDAGEAAAADPSNDCNDASASINPGATEVCDGVDNNCASSTTDEAGLVTTTAGASVTNVTGPFTSAAAPVAITPANGDSYAFCGGAGSHYVRFSIGNGVVATISGRNGAVLNAGTSGGGGAIIDVAAGASGGRAVLAGLSLTDLLTLTGGSGKLVATTARLGGAIYAEATAAPATPTVALTNVAVTGNTAEDGGAMYLANRATASITDSQVHANTATVGVGGIFVEELGALTCTGRAGVSTLYGIYNNVGVTDGGVFLMRAGPDYASFTATTCDFGTAAAANTNKYGAGPTYTNQDVFAENGGSGTSYFFDANDRTVTCTGGACSPYP